MMHRPLVLHLNLHREFFAGIAAGTKKTDYRARQWLAALSAPVCGGPPASPLAAA
jgi:hypothetical protein